MSEWDLSTGIYSDIVSGTNKIKSNLFSENVKKRVFGFPTETVYGLGAVYDDKEAVEQIFKVKGRPADNPLIVHVAFPKVAKRWDMFNEVVDLNSVPDIAVKLMERFWNIPGIGDTIFNPNSKTELVPIDAGGPLTFIFRRSERVPDIVTAGNNTVAVRYPSHKTAQYLINTVQRPIAAPSANLSGSPSPTTAKQVINDLDGRVEVILDSGQCEIGLESTVITFKDIEKDSFDRSLCKEVIILRPGAVTKEMLESVAGIGNVSVAGGVLNELQENEKALSPGMKHKHYAPLRSKIVLVKGSYPLYKEYVIKHARPGDWCLIFEPSEKVGEIPYLCYGNTHKQQAHSLFERLREFDDKGVNGVIFARCPDTGDLGLAVYNRIIRSAGFNVVEV